MANHPTTLAVTAAALSMFAKDVVALTTPPIQGFPGDTTAAYQLRTRTKPAIGAGLFFGPQPDTSSMFAKDVYELGADMAPVDAVSAFVGLLTEAEAIAAATEAGVKVPPTRARALAARLVELAPYGHDFPAIRNLELVASA